MFANLSTKLITRLIIISYIIRSGLWHGLGILSQTVIKPVADKIANNLLVFLNIEVLACLLPFRVSSFCIFHHFCMLFLQIKFIFTKSDFQWTKNYSENLVVPKFLLVNATNSLFFPVCNYKEVSCSVIFQTTEVLWSCKSSSGTLFSVSFLIFLTSSLSFVLTIELRAFLTACRFQYWSEKYCDFPIYLEYLYIFSVSPKRSCSRSLVCLGYDDVFPSVFLQMISDRFTCSLTFGLNEECSLNSPCQMWNVFHQRCSSSFIQHSISHFKFAPLNAKVKNHLHYLHTVCFISCQAFQTHLFAVLIFMDSFMNVPVPKNFLIQYGLIPYLLFCK